MASSLLNHSSHITQNLKSEAIDIHHSFKLPQPDPSILPLIERAGFADVVSIGSFKIIPSLITAMIERWRPETHTFHLPVGECTITLQDVALHLGLPVDGNVVTGSCEYNWDEVCVQLLGRPIPPNAMVGNQIKFTWLHSEFNQVPEGASSRQLRQHCRAYLMMLIGGVILPDKSSNRVNIKYLPLLSKFDKIGSYSWGSACLTNLYRMLCKTATCTSSSMGGCTLLLQSWVWYRMKFIAPSCGRPYDWPLAKRWVGTRLNHTATPTSLIGYRGEIDHMSHEQFEWLPYNGIPLPQIAYRDSGIWTTNTAMVCFHMVEWHHADRVKLQFGLLQDPPSPPVDLTQFHVITMQGQTDVNWEERHGPSIELWNDRQNQCVVGQPCYGKPAHSEKYMRWFYKNSKPFISDDQHLRDPRALLDVGLADEEEEQDLPPPPTTQTERRERNRNRRGRGARSQEVDQTFQQTQEYEPHRESFSHPPRTFEEYEAHRQSVDTYQRPTDMFYDLFGCHPGTPESQMLLRRLQEEAGGASSSNAPQYNPNPPADVPGPSNEEEQPQQRRQRPHRVPRPRRCGTGSHLFR